MFCTDLNHIIVLWYIRANMHLWHEGTVSSINWVHEPIVRSLLCYKKAVTCDIWHYRWYLIILKCRISLISDAFSNVLKFKCLHLVQLKKACLKYVTCGKKIQKQWDKPPHQKKLKTEYS